MRSSRSSKVYTCPQSAEQKLTGRKICPYGPDRTLSMVPGSCKQSVTVSATNYLKQLSNKTESTVNGKKALQR